VQRSTVKRAEVSLKAKPGKPAAEGGARQPSYFHPATEAGFAEALGIAVELGVDTGVLLLVKVPED